MSAVPSSIDQPPAERLSSGFECPMSLEPLESNEIYILRCGHSFGPDVVTLIANRIMTKCPMCSAPIRSKPVRNYTLELALNEHAKLRNESALKDRCIKELQSENLSLKSLVQQCLAAQNSLQIALTESRTAHKETKALLAKTEETLKKTEETLKKTEEEAKEEKAKLLTTIDDCKAINEKMTRQMEELKAKMDAMNSSPAPAVPILPSIRNEKEMAELKADNAQLKEEVSALKSTNDQRQKQISSLEATNAKFKGEIQDLNDRMRQSSECCCTKLINSGVKIIRQALPC